MAEAKTPPTLEEEIKALNKQSPGSVIHGDKLQAYTTVISTGSLGLDIALGIGGLPLGKIVELYGWESSGKSTLVQTIIGNAQKKDLKCLYVDGENSLEENYSKALGINLKDLYIIQLDEAAGEGAYNKMERLVATGEISVVVIDSYNSLQPLKLLEGEVGDSTMGIHSRMMGQVVMKANSLAAKHNCLFLFVGQLREKIGVMFGSPETTQGGNALKFYAHARLQVSRSTTLENSVMDGKEKLGNKTTVKVVKTKFGAPFKSASFDIIYGQGIDRIGEIIDVASEFLPDEEFKKFGKTITVDGTRHKEEEYRQLLVDNPGYYDALKERILDKTIRA